MPQETIALLSLGIAIIGALAGLFAWGLRRVDKQFQKIEQSFEKEFGTVHQSLSVHSEKIDHLSIQVARLEGSQGRFLLSQQR